MILEVATLNVREGQTADFEAAFAIAQQYIAQIEGYRGHQLQRCLENSHQYLLLVQWESLEAHTIGFRQSPQYQEWRRLLHHFYDPFPTVEHYETVL
ncbi:MAG: antibiotic biosynthesis monooxygenase [Chloroflexi bacterium]|nr:antibiotic biosynthesis monooxygenase [Chloroflexota bacterium]